MTSSGPSAAEGGHAPRGAPTPTAPRPQESGTRDMQTPRGGSGPCRTVKERHGPKKPDPWYQMYWAVVILLALVAWSFYVVVGRLCAPMIRGDSSTGLSKATGAGTLVGFVILWLLFVWSYSMILFVGPGFARDHCPKVAPPHTPPLDNPVTGLPVPQQDNRPINSAATQVTNPPEASSQVVHSASQPIPDPDDAPDPSELAPVAAMVSNAINAPQSDRPSSSATVTREAPPGTEETVEGRQQGKKQRKDWRELQRPVPIIDVGPRWCKYCEINKPDRTHHCRHCGTCVMQFDHHCPWIGQCVGWRNHKFFMNFCLLASIYCTYIVIFLAVAASKMSDLDGQVVGLITVAALFDFFSGSMYLSHYYLIITGKSTVDAYRSRDQKEHEAVALQAEYGLLWHNQEKRKVKRRWKEEWGGVDIDERWRWGNSREMWEQEMGTNWLGWILPIGRPQGDGLHFKSNPHFGPHGEWLQRKDWPKELQGV